MNHVWIGTAALGLTALWVLSIHGVAKAKNHGTSEKLWVVPMYVLPAPILVAAGITFYEGDAPSINATFGVIGWFIVGVCCIRPAFKRGMAASHDHH